MPPYASLMVAVDLDPTATERIKLASSLADRRCCRNSQLTGLGRARVGRIGLLPRFLDA
jgi:hypothetical protein